MSWSWRPWSVTIWPFARCSSGWAEQQLAKLTRPEALGALDRTLAQHPEPFATAICVVWRPAGGRVRLANAGHIPPVVVEDHGAGILDHDPEPPLGIAGVRSFSEHEIPRGAALVLCTDGLIERRHNSLAHGLAVLRSVLSRRPPGETAAFSVFTDILQELGPLEDDAAVVLVRATAGAGDGQAPPSTSRLLEKTHRTTV